MSVFAIRETYQQLKEALLAFNAAWPATAMTAEVYPLPILEEQEVPAQIAVAPLTGAEALVKAQDAYTALEFQDQQHRATVMRLPGWIAVSQDFRPEIAHINALKHALRDHFQAYRPGTRPQMARQALGKVSLLQAYREIQAPWPLPTRLSFTWVARTSSIERIRVADLMKQLEETKGHVPQHIQPKAIDPAALTPAAWANLLEREIALLQQFTPETLLVRKRPVAPHPRALLLDDHGRPQATLHATVPMLLHVPDGDMSRLPQIQALPSFDRDALAKQRHRRDARRLQLLPLIERIGLYLESPGVRPMASLAP